MRRVCLLLLPVLMGLLLVCWFARGSCLPAKANPIAKTPAQTRADFQSVASKLPFFFCGDLAYARRPSSLGPSAKQLDEYMSLIQTICDPANDKQTTISLLNDADPKVRTLALASLFDREEPALLKYFVPLCKDTAETFKTYVPCAYAGLTHQEKLPDENQKVGQIAQQFLARYLEPAGFYYGIEARPDVNYGGGPRRYGGFEGYWNERKDRKYCASWYEVRMERATQGTMPLRAVNRLDLQKIIQEIKRLNAPDCSLELLYLGSVTGVSDVLNNDALLSQCKLLSPEQLLHVLQRKPDSRDPDIRPHPSNNYRYTCMMNFILAHAPQLLRREQLPALLACRKFENEFSKHGITDPNRTALWSIAIADIDRKNAKQVLFDQIKQQQKEPYRSENCALLAAGVARILGESQKQFLVNYFFAATEPSEITTFQRAYIDKLKQVPEPLRTSLLKAIMHDRRADSAHIWVWMDLTSQFEKQLGKAKMTQYWSTLQQLPWNLLDPKSAAQLPEDAKKMQKTFAEVRAALRRANPAH